jgi:hypothetical protein
MLSWFPHERKLGAGREAFSCMVSLGADHPLTQSADALSSLKGRKALPVLFATWGAVGEVMLGLKRRALCTPVTAWRAPAPRRRALEARECCEDWWLARGWFCKICSAGGAGPAELARASGRPALPLGPPSPWHHFGCVQ